MGAVQGLLLIPPFFELLFAPSALLVSDRRFLWILAALSWLASFYIFFIGRTKRLPSIAALYFSLVLMIAVELAARLYICQWLPELKAQLAQKGRLAYQDLSAYRGHPFLQFTGNPNATLVEDRIIGGHFNNFGFRGRDFQYLKPPGTLRIAFLGGSTTADGYPALVEEFLGKQLSAQIPRVESLNFGHGWYNSAHSVANFVFNVRDFAPDYVVIHDGANDKIVRGFPGEFRGDYAHILKTFEVPLPADWVPLRLSVLYRLARFYLFPRKVYAGLDEATVFRVSGLPPDRRYTFPEELGAFRRNIKTILDLALIDAIVPVLTTQPYRVSVKNRPEADHRSYVEHIRETNEIVRQIAAEYGGKVVFVDLSSEMSGKMEEEFIDYVHLSEKGRWAKAKAVGRAILEHYGAGPAGR